MNTAVHRDLNRGAFITGLGMALKVSEFGLTLLAARLFGAATFGQYVFLTTLVMPLLRFATAGADRGLIWFIPRHRDHAFPPGFFARLRWTVIGLTALVFLGYAAYLRFHPLRLQAEGRLVEPVAFLLTLLAVPFLALTNLNLGVSQGMKKMEHDVLVRTIAYPLLHLGVPCLMALWTRNIRMLAFMYLAGSAGGFVLSELLAAPLKREIQSARPAETTASADFRTLWQYSFPMGVREFLQSLLQRLDIWCLTLYLDARAVGIYGLALSLANSLKTVRQSFDSILIAVVSGLKRRADASLIRQAFLHSAKLINLVQFPILAFLAVFCRRVLALSGPDYSRGGFIVLLFASTFLLSSVLGLGGNIVMGLGKSRWGVGNDLLQMGSTLSLCLWLIPRHGLNGAAVAISAAVILVCVVYYFQAMYLLKRVLLDRDLAANFAAGLACLGAVGWMRARWPATDWGLEIGLFAGYLAAYGAWVAMANRKVVLELAARWRGRRGT